MSTSPANMKKSLHGFSSPLTLGPQLSAVTDVDPKSDPSPETPPVSNRTVASRSSRQPRLSFSSLAPSSERDHQKKVKSEENPPRREEVPASAEEDEEKRKWNLRPRKACGGGASEAKNQKPVAAVVEAKSNRQRGIPAESPGLGGGGGGVESKNENHRLWVALSRDEIEEDVFSMSGNRPSRRPRKRTKTLQKHLDVIFPGLCLVGMNADCFRVSTSPAKVLLGLDQPALLELHIDP
ncbi:BnaC07g34320D [Brassica napus]|uniref:BnaC07g34320D protein n=1 Tax=Brassica napus TaxID=3708 RepID=A0A078F9F3_BRANA|nr:BnaC07g34320D [Brassica napus]